MEWIAIGLVIAGMCCLIATATYGSELAPQVPHILELRDDKLQTETGVSFVNRFNEFCYSSPVIADYERENPLFQETAKIVIPPMISSFSILNHVDVDSDQEVLWYGIFLILLNMCMLAFLSVLFLDLEKDSKLF